LDELKLIKDCLKKDYGAQKALFDGYYSQMYNLGMRLLANHHDTEDVLIIAFTRVFDKIGSFEYRGDNSLKKWVKTIVINEAIRFLELKKDLLLVESSVVLENDMYVEEGLVLLNTDEAYRIIENMPAGYRTVFNLYAIEGYTHQEVAEMLNITQSTSKSQLCKARNYIITQLKKNNSYGIPKFG
jgi:RNA polymerase sigma-70 factor (ECF subfamily)